METSNAAAVIQFPLRFSQPPANENPIHQKEKQAYDQIVNYNIQQKNRRQYHKQPAVQPSKRTVH